MPMVKNPATAMALHVTVTIPDLGVFLSQAEHAGTLSGHVDCALLGGTCTVQSGTFRLMPNTEDRDRKVMYYQVYATTPSGAAITFVGQKEVQHTAPRSPEAIAADAVCASYGGTTPLADRMVRRVSSRASPFDPS